MARRECIDKLPTAIECALAGGSMAEKLKGAEAVAAFRSEANGQVVLVLQGGGALGAYQVGVYQALHEAGVEPDWVVGTSIGAINACLIAGNAPARRLEAIREFWRRVQSDHIWHSVPNWFGFGEAMSYWTTLLNGISGFFSPNPAAFAGAHLRLGAGGAGFYSTMPLRKTLDELVDLALLNRGPPRLTVGAAHVRSSTMRYFDSREKSITIDHILASGALPPAFPAVRIDGELYWDGGIMSNTPTEVIFDDDPRRSSLIFAVHMWNPDGPEPETILEVLHRQKDIQYSSRIAGHITRLKQTHTLRHVVTELARLLPDDVRNSAAAKELASYGCLTRMHVIRLLAPRIDNENHTKDIDFSPSGIRRRRDAGYEATMRALDDAPWRGQFDPIEGVILHEAMPKRAMAAK
jgi:NTE family protein